MTVGEKITKLRTEHHMSQEQLADKLEVSRQSVSKWEMDQSMPGLDKVRLLCKLFDLSTDELIWDELNVERKVYHGEETLPPSAYYATNRLQGEANADLDCSVAYRVGRFLGWYYQSALSGCKKPGYRPRVVIGKDTRRSSYMLEYSLVAGLSASGADAHMLHVTTTPSVSYVTHMDGFDCGIMISASHTPYYNNGIRIVDGNGEKLTGEPIRLLDAYLDGDMEKLGLRDADIPLAKCSRIGTVIDYVAGRNRYIGYLVSIAAHSYNGLKVGLDCANGSSWSIAKAVFDALGAKTYLMGASPDGININKDCGTAHMEALSRFVTDQGLNVGFAFDGDGDRCLAVDENGRILTGDLILYILAKILKRNGSLDGNTVVTTPMANSGFLKALKDADILYESVPVGEPYVGACIRANNYRLGGEQSGYILLRKYATNGDGILTAIMLMEEMCERKLPLAALCEGITLVPQILASFRVKDKRRASNDEELLSRGEFLAEEMRGRVSIRASSIEPVIRIMAEGPTTEQCEACIKKLYAILKKNNELAE